MSSMCRIKSAFPFIFSIQRRQCPNQPFSSKVVDCEVVRVASADAPSENGGGDGSDFEGAKYKVGGKEKKKSAHQLAKDEVPALEGKRIK